TTHLTTCPFLVGVPSFLLRVIEVTLSFWDNTGFSIRHQVRSPQSPNLFASELKTFTSPDAPKANLVDAIFHNFAAFALSKSLLGENKANFSKICPPAVCSRVVFPLSFAHF